MLQDVGFVIYSTKSDALKRKQVAEHIQVKMAYDMKVVGPDLGYFWSAIVQ